MMFKNRQEAAQLLAEQLVHYFATNSVVLAIPRGGVPLGSIIAKKLHLPLDLLLSKKIGHPSNKEYAIGAVTPFGYSLNEGAEDVDQSYILQEVERIREMLLVKQKKFLGNKKPIDLKGKNVIIVDDGIATGQTIRATLDNIREQGPNKIIIAVPVAPIDTANLLKTKCDEFVCLYKASAFNGIGEFYQDFTQVEDNEVKALLFN